MDTESFGSLVERFTSHIKSKKLPDADTWEDIGERLDVMDNQM